MASLIIYDPTFVLAIWAIKGYTDYIGEQHFTEVDLHVVFSPFQSVLNVILLQRLLGSEFTDLAPCLMVRHRMVLDTFPNCARSNNSLLHNPGFLVASRLIRIMQRLETILVLPLSDLVRTFEVSFT